MIESGQVAGPTRDNDEVEGWPYAGGNDAPNEREAPLISPS